MDKTLNPPVVQLTLYQVEKQIEYDGVEMGVLENGLPYLTESGLARMCGITNSALNLISSNWAIEKLKPRGKEISKLLIENKFYNQEIFLRSELNGSSIKAYPEPVCMAFLEYYAFISKPVRIEAQNAFRTLARTSFRNFIYKATGYSPEQRRINSWRHYHDRLDMLLNKCPAGYFSIFSEIAVMIIPMIRAEIIISDKLIPDISVGQIWSNYWNENNFDDKFGKRIRYEHEYPEYYPQAKSNPQLSYAYPDECLGEFRKWLRENYIQTKFPKYIITKIKDMSISSTVGQKALNAFGVNPALKK